MSADSAFGVDRRRSSAVAGNRIMGRQAKACLADTDNGADCEDPAPFVLGNYIIAHHSSASINDPYPIVAIVGVGAVPFPLIVFPPIYALPPP